MKFDETTKVISIISVVVGLIISVAGFLTNRKLDDLKASVTKNEDTLNKLRIQKQTYEDHARIQLTFDVVLASAFVDLYQDNRTPGTTGPARMQMAIPQLEGELQRSLPAWADRRGLMTGTGCKGEGLKARQIVMLKIDNIGYSDVESVVLHVKLRKSPYPDPRTAWRLPKSGPALSYADLLSAKDGWSDAKIDIPPIGGTGSPGEYRRPVRVVLASVSGGDSLFGTVVVPVGITWRDVMHDETLTKAVPPASAAELRSYLLSYLGHADCSH